MKYLSLFSGIEAASVAWKPLGWECVGVSEIDPFPCAVLKHRFPNIPNLGDVSKITEEKIDELKRKHGTIDVVVGGSPCQSFSVAGARKGLEDPRGNLMYQYIRIVETVRPKWFVWENVPGVFSSNEGRDFGTLLQAMAQLGYSLTWRTLDAQFFGIPQRRRRVFLVGHLGTGCGGFNTLFERKSLSRDTEESTEQRKDNSSQAQSSPRSDDSDAESEGECYRKVTRARSSDDAETWELSNVANTLNTYETSVYRTTVAVLDYDPTDKDNKGVDSDTPPRKTVMMFNPSQPNNDPIETDKSVSLIARMGTGGNQVPLIVSETKQDQPKHTVVEHVLDYDLAGTLVARDCKGTLSNEDISTYSQKVVVEHTSEFDKASTIIARDSNGIGSDAPLEGKLVCVSNTASVTSKGNGDVWENSKTFGSLCSDGGMPGQGYAAVRIEKRVRRLTPLECERLQGFPDNWTRIPYRKKEAKDCPKSPRYKALGNSMAVPVMRWIGEGIMMTEGLKVPSASPLPKKKKYEVWCIIGQAASGLNTTQNGAVYKPNISYTLDSIHVPGITFDAMDR